ncbi:Periodic tryptophan protein 2 -like protein [Sarcoptes scabiei]|uniref:Periodic tryptophan protein 2 -like protein n=1 Tax=Sarcoptes scabiei TaxID=52283 RepID=A0A834VGV1_SARSC|nr:Periodic tryptophan protein 2 -like protein [Sarcoptes scabiei]
MRYSYKFHNVLGSIYEKANLEFASNDLLFSPCGNKIIIYDLKRCKSEALPFEIQYNITSIALSPDCAILLITTERNQLFIVSLISNAILHRKDFKDIGTAISSLKFSPDGKYYAVCGSNKPGYEDLTSIAWNERSKIMLVTSRDYSIRVYPIDKAFENSHHITLNAHNDLIIGAFFSNNPKNPSDIFSISRNGQMFAWKSNHHELNKENWKQTIYKIDKRKFLFDDLKEKNSGTFVSAYAYEPKSQLATIAYNDGRFMLYDLSEILLIHSLQLSNQSPISSLTFNENGAWIAIGCSVGAGNKYDFENEISTQTQLIVWEWQSETFILKQTGYSESITNSYECLAYSPDASLMVTGGTDGRIKVWNLNSGFCLSTFSTEHKGPVTGLEFIVGKDGKVFVSCSLDGTVKAFDLNRYRCFRTLAAPNDSRPAQFICLAVDKIGGDFIAAGSHNFFEIFLWSLKTGRLLEMLTGHEGPVSSVKFSPNSNTLYSCSWDSTVRIWNLYEGSNCSREIIKLGSDALCLDIRDDGRSFAVATLNGTISFFDAQSGRQLGIGIEGKQDLGISRYKNKETDDKNKYFSTISFSIDGEHIIAAGKSKFVCIYNIKEKLLIKRIEISNNLSLDGFNEFISKRKIQEFGFDLEQLKNRDEQNSFAPIALPGVIKSDCADRQLVPIVSVQQIRFSPTMRTFSIASTEGVIIYTLDKTTIFDPFDLDSSISLQSFLENIKKKNFTQALIDSIKLNETKLVQEAIEKSPIDQINLIVSNLSTILAEKLLQHIAKLFEKTKHLEFYLQWILSILKHHTTKMKSFRTSEQTAMIVRLHQIVSNKQQDILKIFDFIRYTNNYLQLIPDNLDNNLINDDVSDKEMCEKSPSHTNLINNDVEMNEL